MQQIHMINDIYELAGWCPLNIFQYLNLIKVAVPAIFHLIKYLANFGSDGDLTYEFWHYIRQIIRRTEYLMFRVRISLDMKERKMEI